jgi:hypothetical protein
MCTQFTNNDAEPRTQELGSSQQYKYTISSGDRLGSAENLAVAYCRVTELTAYKRNARTHSKAQIRKIAESIRAFGFRSCQPQRSCRTACVASRPFSVVHENL